MNHTKLVGILKTLVTEAHHNARYNYGRKKLAGAPLHVPDKAPQLAEDDKEPSDGTTMTKQKANKINTEPGYSSQIEPTRGDHNAHKPQTLDTK